ncbi:MAG: hypothetical protein PVG70_21175 [Desulfobacterales bacterium]|jgi:hypothetical protein
MSESRGCLSFEASKGEAVIVYCEPLATKKMGWHRLSHGVNKVKLKIDKLHLFRS